MATNVAASANGGTATKSSEAVGFEATKANNSDRTGSSGYWNDNTSYAFDDWLQIDFASATISEIDVFSLQDNFGSPVTPTLTMLCTLYGLKDFDIQYWTGSAWATVTGGAITGNNHVWVQVTFTAVTTTKIRILVHSSQDGQFSRCVELEAWTAPSAPGAPSSPSPADLATGVSLTPTLSWTSSGATRYDVYFGTAASPPLVSTDQTSATYLPTGLSGSTAYHWKIVAKNLGGSTTGSVWTFTTGAFASTGSVKPTLIVEAELSGSGLGWTDISRDVIRNAGVRCRHGMQGGSPQDLVAPTGTATFALNNSTTNSAHLLGYYSPYHANCRSGWRRGILCRIRFQNPNTGAYSTRFVGYVDAIDPTPGIHGPRDVTVTLTDWFDEAARFVIPPSIGTQVEQTWDQILTAIIGEMSTQPTATSFDVGSEVFPYALDTISGSKQYALSEFAKLAASEYGQIYQKADGTVRAEGRHSRLLNTTVSWTITENDLQSLSMPSTRSEIINKALVTIHPRIVDALPTTVVYDQEGTPELAQAQTLLLRGSYRDPVTGDPIGAIEIQTQVSGTDYNANSNADGTGTDYHTNMIITVDAGPNGAEFSVFNGNAATVFLTVNRLLGRGLYDRAPQTLQAEDSVSIAQNQEHAIEFDMPYQSNAFVGQGLADYIKIRYSSAFAQVRGGHVIADSSTLLAQLLARDVSDLVTITETLTGASGNFFINGMELRLTPAGNLEADYIFAPAYDPFSGLYWILGTSTLGTNTLPARL
jgi:hypothetical protein